MKRRNAYIHWLIGVIGVCLSACSNGPVTLDREEDSLPEIIPDYKEVTIPVNIAPLNFGLSEKTEPIKQAIARFSASDYTFQVAGQSQVMVFEPVDPVLTTADGYLKTNSLNIRILTAGDSYRLK